MSSGDSNNTNSEAAGITITLVSTATGRTESIPMMPPTATITELGGWCRALFGFGEDEQLAFFKEGKRIASGAASTTLQSAGIADGDMVAVQSAASASAGAAPSAAPSSAGGGGLDFSGLLSQPQPGAQQGGANAAGGGTGGGLDFSSLLQAGGAGGGGGRAAAAAAAAAPPGQPPAPVYYPGMNLDEAIHYNPHPHTLMTLLQSKEHLFKELNYYKPQMAEKLKGQTLERQVQLWQEDMVRGSIQGALKKTQLFHKERDMKKRLEDNPEDPEAKAYFDKQKKQAQINEQYAQMMEEYPESMARVLMLYVNVKINGHNIQAFCDSGAQSTIMSKKVATECDLMDWVDTRFHGVAVGVGTGKIIGRIHLVQLQIDNYHFPCSVTVMDDPPPGASEMPFLLGLDMMKRHTCVMDFGKGVLKFRLSPGQYLETPFLHEKDLDESKGGTKGFDATASNQKVREEMDRQKDSKAGEDEDGDASMS